MEKRVQAYALLILWLADVPLRCTVVMELANEAGISGQTLRRAKRVLGIVSVRDRWRWWWAMDEHVRQGVEGKRIAWEEVDPERARDWAT